MFLQFFVWGSWYVTAGTFVPARGWDQATTGWVYSAGPIAALISPLFLGLIADRFFASQRVLAVLHLIGAAIMFYVPSVAAANDVDTFEWLILVYMLCYMPTLGLSNTVAFTHIEDPEKQFPLARVFGTLGWIAAVTLVSKGLGGDQDAIMFQVAGASSAVMAGLCMILPHTPPPAADKQVSLGETLGLGALALFARPAFVVFVLCSFLICIPLAGYYSYGNQFAATVWQEPGFYMTFGQWAEVVFMLVMPLCFARLGVKWMLAFGMLAWVVRYGLWSAGAGANPVGWMVIGGILLHGICYDFFFVTGQIYVDRSARREIRGQAQSFLVWITQGLGMLIGAQLMTALVKQSTPAEGAPDWPTIWLWPCLGAGAILLVFVALFRERPGAATPAPESL
ncbi:MAG: MFS transporter [Planctomycetes bacterium]|nr:MFS transporter [Planctomycetota bacterium]